MSMNYRIRVKGHLDPSWQEWFEGLQMVQEEEGTPLLAGFLRDQAALYGILLKIRTLGLTLLSLESEEVPENESGAPSLPIFWARHRGHT